MNLPNKKVNILWANPGMEGKPHYIPTHAAYVRYFTEKLVPAEKLFWLPPIWQQEDFEKCREQFQNVDVLALSFYIWNRESNKELIRAVRGLNPQLLVVAGGPEIDLEDDDIFSKEEWKQVDIISRGDSEIIFPLIVSNYLEGQPFENIPSLYLNKSGQRHSTSSGPALRCQFDDLQVDPLTKYEEFLTPALKKISSQQDILLSIWETNRGCPYSCTFCNWGSSTMSKIRQIPTSVLSSQIEWFGRNKVDAIDIADANFGILPRDMTLLDQLISVHRETGYPRWIFFEGAKNNSHDFFEAMKRLNQEGMVGAPFQIATQSQYGPALKAIKRFNISNDKIIELIKNCQKETIPFLQTIILGCPGENRESFLAGVDELLSRSPRNRIRVNPFILLPNSPAASATYMKTHEIQTVRRSLLLDTGSKHLANYVVSSKDLSLSDYLNLRLYSEILDVFHNGGLAVELTYWLKKWFGIPSSQIHLNIMAAADELNIPEWETTKESLKQWTSNMVGSKPVFVENEGRKLTLSEALWLKLFFDRNLLQKLLKRTVELSTPETFQSDARLDELMSWQLTLVIDPETKKKNLLSNINWLKDGTWDTVAIELEDFRVQKLSSQPQTNFLSLISENRSHGLLNASYPFRRFSNTSALKRHSDVIG